MMTFLLAQAELALLVDLFVRLHQNLLSALNVFGRLQHRQQSLRGQGDTVLIAVRFDLAQPHQPLHPSPEAVLLVQIQKLLLRSLLPLIPPIQ